VKITNLHIENFKSLLDVEIRDPNPFTIFVGPNGSGKSNCFESIQLASLPQRFNSSKESYKEWIKVFGGYESIKPKIENSQQLFIRFEDDSDNIYLFFDGLDNIDSFGNPSTLSINAKDLNQNDTGRPHILNIQETQWPLLKNCSRISLGKSRVNRVPESPSDMLESDGANLENILKKILEDPTSREEITEWLQIFVPEFDRLEIQTSALSGISELAIYEKKLEQPISKNLISDGTHNILCMLALIFQSKEPQFLLIEEPENGLHPYVIKELVNFFRQQCAEKGHYIWINSHSQTLVDELQPHEIILVDKRDGATQMKQLPKDKNLHGLKMDFAWLSNALGGGVPW
jgi:predicted ATPase